MSAVALSLLERVPTFVRNLNAMAERGGMRVRLEIEPYEGEIELRLWSVWEGSKAQLASLQLFTPRQMMLLPIGAYRTKGATIAAPPAGIAGPMQCSGDSVRWEIDSGAWPCTVEQRGEVEVVTCRDAVTYWGTLEALVAFGIDRKRLPVGKVYVRSIRRNGLGAEDDDKPYWTARRLLDGTVRYQIETEECMRRRQQEHERWMKEHGYEEDAPPSEEVQPKQPEAVRPRPDWLRLVVDNTVQR